MASDDLSDDSGGYSSNERTERRGFTRRRALAVLGSGLVGAGVAGSVGADSHDAVVYESAGTWYAENGGEEVYSGDDMIDAMQAGVDSLSSGRTSIETVLVEDSGTVGPVDDVHAVELPSYTALDVRGTITVDDSGDNLVIPIRARDAESIEIPTVSIEGNPRYGIWIQSCSDVYLGDVEMSLEDAEVGLGVRIDDAEGGRTQTVQLDSADISGSSSHAVETYGVDDVTIGTVETTDTGGCGLLLNDTTDASVDLVDAVRADEGGGYAGFRCANDCGPNVHVDEVRATDCGRGIFTVSGSEGITIDEVAIDGCGSNLIQDTRDLEINGGTIENNAGEGVRIDSRDDDDHHHTRDVTIQNVGIYDNDYGVQETGPNTEENAILDNDFCDNGTDIDTYADSTEVSGNTFCDDNGGGGGGGDDGPISEGTYRIANVNSGAYLEVESADTDEGANVQQWSDTGHATQEWHVEEESDGVYVLENANSGHLLDVEAAGTDDGDTLIQWSDTGGDNQRFTLEDEGSGEYRIENVESGLVVEVEANGTDDGDDVVQWEWNDGANQRWTFDEV